MRRSTEKRLLEIIQLLQSGEISRTLAAIELRRIIKEDR